MRVFYGWYVLGGLFTVYAVSNGVTNFTLPLFYPSLMEEFGWVLKRFGKIWNGYWEECFGFSEILGGQA